MKNNARTFCFRTPLILLAGWLLFCEFSYAQTADSAEKIRRSIVKAGDLYQSGKVNEAVHELNEANSRLLALLKATKDARELKVLKNLHHGLIKAYEKLELDGVELKPLFSWDEISKPTHPANPEVAGPSTSSTPSTGIRFATDVAPWLLSKCGRCHIHDAKGGFSAANLEAILKGGRNGSFIIAKDADHSRLVEVIESGDMPRGGAKVLPSELAKLKEWINSGMRYEPAQLKVPLAMLTRQSGYEVLGVDNQAMMKAEFSKPTGRETVSFTRDIAPILMTNCNGCHYDARRAQGDLDMDTFKGLWKGGESGSIIEVGKPTESLLVKMLEGQGGKRMPQGRPALVAEQIRKVSTWISEGASFDGYSADAKLQQVVDQAWAETASPEDMMARRIQRAIAKWKVAFSQVEPFQASDEDFVVLGDLGQAGVDQLLIDARSAYEKIRKGLKLKTDQPITKGGVTIFAMKSRYGYGEFGKMNETRTLPSQWTSHWHLEMLDVYVALSYNAKDRKANEANLIQQLSSLWLASKGGTPTWFADGFGRAVLAMIGGRNEPKIKQWDQQVPVIANGIDEPKELLDGKMNEEDAGILGYAIVRRMIDSSSRRPFDQFVSAVQQTQDFDKAITQAIGPLDRVVADFFGKSRIKARR